MDSSMKDRNDEKAWAAYEKEGQKLMREAVRRREEISERHKNDPPMKGIGTSPEMREASNVTKWFGQEIQKLRKKYGIK